jgi:hypothetical protein
MSSSKPTDQTFAILRDALSEAQTTVRSYDTKAQIVGVGYIFALGIVGSLGDRLPDWGKINALAVLFGWGVVIVPILLFGYVLFPTRKTASTLAEDSTDAGRLEHVLYVEPERHSGIEALKASVASCDPLTEYTFELITVSNLREIKRKRFLRALFASAVAFLSLFGTQIYRGLLP